MKILFALFVSALALAPAVTSAQDGHEYSALVEKTVNYKNWTLNDLKDNKPVDLRSLVQGKKLVMVVYFAPWCPNWRNEAPVAAKLYEKYKDQGFAVIGVSEYGARDTVNTFFAPAGPPYPVVSESELREDRDKTAHFGYRQLTGDTRKWGSPWNIFLEPSSLAKTGDVLTEKAWVVNGELIEADVDKFIADHLKTSTA
ncbi:MAG TPA: TlpA disulfide reductase family protein, partial [Pyrinomonadaceae bacterium]|nr:TlpA disulfide reductase family protein [Pyrinomonadaceae bacterium]